MRNKNRRKKKDKEKEREKDYAYREQIPDFVRCYRAGVTWCLVARLLRSQSPRKSTPRTTARETRGVCEWTTISTSQIVGTNEQTKERDGTGSKALCFAFTTIDGSMTVSGGKVKPPSSRTVRGLQLFDAARL